MHSNRQPRKATIPTKQEQEDDFTNTDEYDNRVEFLNLALHTPPDFSKTNTLGTISNDPKYYFQVSEECQKYAEEFLNVFWSNPKNVEDTIKTHQNKFEKKTTQSQEKGPLFPSCICFVAATIQNKKYCFISLNIPVSKIGIHGQLRKFIDQYNKIYNGDTEFVLLTLGHNSNILYLLNQTKKTNNKMKKCSEIIYGSFLMELYLKYGNQLRVTGSINCLFYPYQFNKEYGDHPDSIDTTVKTVLANNLRIELNNNMYVTSIPCCQSCQENKPALFHLWKMAQNNHIAQNKLHDHSITLRFLVQTQTSLFSNPPITNTVSVATSSTASNPLRKIQ